MTPSYPSSIFFRASSKTYVKLQSGCTFKTCSNDHTSHHDQKGGFEKVDSKKHFFVFFEKFWLGGAAPQTPNFWLGGQIPPRPCNGKHIQFISIECNLMLRVISEASVMTCSSHDSRDMSSIRLIFKGSPIPYSQTFI